MVAIYFSGHAVDVAGVPYLLARDADPKEPHAKGISLQELLAQLNHPNDRYQPRAEPFVPGHLLVILDACRRSQAKAPNKGITFAGLSRPNSACHTLVLSSQPSQCGVETPFARNSAMTGALLRLIKALDTRPSLFLPLKEPP